MQTSPLHIRERHIHTLCEETPYAHETHCHYVRVSENTHCVSRPTMFQKTNYMSEGTLCQRTYHVREHTMWSSENNILCQKTRRASNKLTCVRKTLCVRKHTLCQTALFKFLV